MRKFIFLFLGLILISSFSFASEGVLPPGAKALYQKAKMGKWFSEVEKISPEILPTSDGRSFYVVWKSVEKPKQWIVSIHGSNGFATDDFSRWHSSLKDRNAGIVCLQWWLGDGDTPKSYYTPIEIYREINIALTKLQVQPNSVMFHGFSRGSANSYAVVAIDAGQGSHYFSLAVASSGGVGIDYPPTQEISRGGYGKNPLQGTRWILVSGAKDPHPDRDGISGMQKTAAWLKSQGAIIVENIEDPTEGHGALQRNSKNALHVIDLFLK